ncbi:MAG: hypothetical protein QXN63_03000 [Candidatus Bathyarchaeia archaeon]
MTSKIRRKFSSFPYFLQKFYWKIATAKPSTVFITLLAVGFSIFLLGGGIYDILVQPMIAIVSSGGRIIFYYPYSISDQFLGESVFIMVLYMIGVAGLWLIYQSTKYAFKPRQASIMLLIGIVFVLLAYVGVELVFSTRFHQMPSS